MSAPTAAGPDGFAPLRRALTDRLDVDHAEVYRAYQTAERWHRGQRRRSGDPFVTHPVEVATIVAGLGQDTGTICAALLHDIVDDTPYTRNQLRAEFGARVAGIVETIGELDRPEYVTALEQRWLSGPAPAAPAEVCVLAVKVADRLHNMRTIEARSLASRARIARATQDVLIPLCDRLGIQYLKREL